MEKVFELLTKEDLYNIAVPLITAIGGWMLSYLINIEKFEWGWKCARIKGNSTRYIQYLLFSVFIPAVIIRIIAIIIMELIKKDLFTYFNIILADFFVQITISIISIIFMVWILCTLKIDMEKYAFKKCIKFQTVLVKLLYYIPIFLCMWILGISNIFNVPQIDFIIMTIMVIIELFSLIYFYNEEKYSYEYAMLKFKDSEIKDIHTKNIYQMGTWIVIEDVENNREIRCRQKDLINVTYQNKKEDELDTNRGENILDCVDVNDIEVQMSKQT